ncbi:MFS transporter [Ramlibacter alkalitolerans]|uniref:MFS transporter n=1 Tax=Ramlibacter alkalitolerans TaxID=2039631 RepID=A0ABS1JLN9_9BURK|nr:MFS transporter [Ramlibacter alkalitolerans]
MVVAHASFAGARLAISLQALHLGGSVLTVGILMSLLMLVPTFTAAHIGRWVDRVGYRRPTLVALLALIAGELVIASLQSLSGLALGTVVVGTSFIVVNVAINHAIGHVAGVAGRTRAFGLTAVGYSLSALFGPMLAGAGIDRVGYAMTFALLAMLPVVAGALLWRAPTVSRPEPSARTGKTAVMDLLRLPPLRAVLVVSTLVAAGWDLFTFLVPLHGARSGLTATAIGLVAGGFGIGSASVRLALPWISRRLGEWPLIGTALALSGLGYLAFPFCRTLGTMLPLAVVLGAVLGCGQPVIMSLLHVTAPPERTGEAVGLRMAMIGLGQTVLPLGVGVFSSALGLAPLFWAIATLMGVGGVYAGRRRN